VSSSKSVLPDNDTVEQVFNALETETAALFDQLDLSFLMDYSGVRPRFEGAEHGYTSHQNCRKASFTASTTISTVLVRWRENSTTKMSGDSAASSVRRPQERSGPGDRVYVSTQRGSF